MTNIDIQDINLEEELNKSSEKKGYDKSQSTPVTQGKRKQLIPDHFLKNKFVVIGGIVSALLLIILFIFFITSGGNKSKSVSTDQEIVSVTNDSKELLLVSISEAKKGQEVKGKVSEEWRKATTDFANDQDLDKFKAELDRINNIRLSALEKIPDDGSEVNTVVIRALNEQKEGLNKAFNTTVPGDAIIAYNEWNSSDRSEDEAYNKALINLLEKINRKYKIKNEGNKTIIEY